MKNNYNPTVPNHGFTHGGTFHADDVFSAALLRILNPDIVIERGFKVPDNFDGIVFDIGGGKYDHHETPRDVRIGGVPYAAFGKLWAVYGPQLVGPDQAKWLDETFIQPLDSTDNGGAPNPLSTVIAGMNPLWNQDEDQNACFRRAVDLTYQMLTRQIEGCESREAAASVAERAIMQKGEIAVLERFAPIMNRLIGSGKAFLVFPSNRGDWNAQVVPAILNSRVPTIPFPERWWGAPEEQLPDGVTFCHPSGFMISAKTEGTAVLACKYAIRHNV